MCVAVALLGVCVLAFSAKSFKAVGKEIGELGAEDVGRLVLVKGVVTNVRQNKGTLFLTVCSKACVSAVAFSPLAEEMASKAVDTAKLAGRFVSVEGKVQEYKGGLEIILQTPTAINVLN